MFSQSSRNMHFLLAATALVSVAQSQNTFEQRRQDYCNAGNLCVTSFDWCQFGRQYSANGTFNTGYCDRRGVGGPGDNNYLYSPALPSIAGIALFLNPFYTLNWTGADSAYPTQVDFTFGPPVGTVNRTAPLWSKNVTESSLRFRFRDIFQELTDRSSSNTSYYTANALGWTAFFTVSQPSRPAQAGINSTDATNEFILSNLDLQYYNREYSQEIQAMQAREDRKWRLGVGIGVGLGVPILLIAAYVLGRMGGKKAVTKGAPEGEKRVSETPS